MTLSLPRLAVALALVAVAGFAAVAPAAVAKAGPQDRVTEYPLAQFAVPGDIETSPDGALYVPDGSLGDVWRVTTDGAITSQDVGGTLGSIAFAGGAAWVTDRGPQNRIVRIATDGTKTPFPVPTRDAFPTDIITGPDGALWFMEGRADKIGRLTTDGAFTEYPLPTRGTFGGTLTVGPDGAIWFTEQSRDKVGRITTAGEITEYPLPAGALPGTIVSAGGSLWVPLRNLNAVARIDTSGQVTNQYALATADADPFDMALGPDGALWIAQLQAGSIARMGLDGTVTREYAIPSGRPDNLTAGPDGAIWFTNGSDGLVGKLDFGFNPPLTAEGTTFEVRAWRPFVRTLATFRDGDPDARPRDYDVVISWGDGRHSRGCVRRGEDGRFEVRGLHLYRKTGTYPVRVRIDDEGQGPDTTVQSTAHVRR